MKKSILIVDDSALIRRIIQDIIKSDPAFQVEDICSDGAQALELLRKKKYDAVLLDVQMPKMDGLQLLDKLHQEKIKATVIMCSSLTQKDAETTMVALERGAVDFVAKPGSVLGGGADAFRENLLSVMHAVLAPKGAEATAVGPAPFVKKSVAAGARKKIILCASSTGGPRALQSIVPLLPENINAPMVLVQHMPAGFTKSMAEYLDMSSQVTVQEAASGEALQKGHVYVAPGDYHLRIVTEGSGGHRIHLDQGPSVGGLRPYANSSIESLADCNYNDILCVVLTGMGSDGTKGILSLGQKKPIHVICQNAESCVVYGMPKSVVESGAADEVLPLSEIAQAITKYVGVR